MSKLGYLLRYVSIVLALAVVSSAQAEERATVWDLAMGTAASDMPDSFVDYACGTNGGPPALLIRHFRDYALCPAEPDGLHEVYFRYNDEQEFVARALEQTHDIERYRGTRVFGFDAIVSAFFDSEGLLRGIRIVSDPRGVEPGDRNDQWRLGDMLRRHFGDEGWHCLDEPLGAREAPVASYFVKRSCSKHTEAYSLNLRQDYYHGAGESFTDEYGKVQPTYFTSTSAFELIAAQGAATASSLATPQ